MIAHMNDDHADALLRYVQHFGQIATATEARLIDLDRAGLDLIARVDGAETGVRIALDPPLKDADDAHLRLVKMAKIARRALG